MGKWITGQEILHRWGAAPFELADAIRAGLVPIDTARGTRRTPDVDPCLVCSGKLALRTCTGCQREIIDRIVDGKQVVTQNRHCRVIGGDGLFETGFLDYIEKAVFALPEVLAYEQAHGLKPATTTPTATTEPGQDRQVDGYARPLPGDKPEDYIQRLKDKGVHDDEIQYRVYEYRLPRWGFSQWKAHCRVNDIDYPPKGLKGDPDRDKYGKAYRDARDRHLARAGASEKSEFMPEKSEFMT